MTNDTESPSQTQPERGLLNFLVQMQPGNAWFGAEPDFKEEKAQIWKSQVLIPHSDSSHAYLGPIDESDEVKEIFPCYKERSPLIFTQNPETPYDLNYLDSRVFRAAPKFERNEAYLEWLEKIEKNKGGFWKALGIFDLIQLSRQGPRYYNHIILDALHFWNSSTRSLHLKCGMLTPMLVYVEGEKNTRRGGWIVLAFSSFSPTEVTSQKQLDYNFWSDVQIPNAADKNKERDRERDDGTKLQVHSLIGVVIKRVSFRQGVG